MPATYLFGEAYQRLWLLTFTTFIESSLTLSIPLTLAPICLVLAEPSSPHGFNGNLHCGYIVSRLFYCLGYC